MPKTIRTAINSLNPKAQLTQGPRSLIELLGASGSLYLSGLYLLLRSLLSGIGLEIKNALLLPLGDKASSSRLFDIEGSYSARAINVNGFKKAQPIISFNQAKQKNRPFDLEKQAKPRVGIDPGGSAPEAKACY